MACEDDDFFTFACLKQHASGMMLPDDAGGGGGGGGGNGLSTSYESNGSFFGLPLEPLADFTYDGAGLDDDFLEDLMDQLDDESSADKFLTDSIFGDFDLMTEEALADVDDFESLILSENDSSNVYGSNGGKDNCVMELDEEVENSKVPLGSMGKSSAPSSPSKKNCSSPKKVVMKSSNNSLLSRMSESNVPRVVMNNRSSNKQNCMKKVSKVKRKKAGVSLLAKPSKQVKSLLDTSSSRLSTRTVPIAAVPSSNNPIVLKTSKGDFRISKVVVDHSGNNKNNSSNACKLVNGMIVKRITSMSQCVSMKAQYVTTKANNQSIQMQKSSSLLPSISSSSTSTSKLLFQDHDYCPPNSSCSLIVIDN